MKKAICTIAACALISAIAASSPISINAALANPVTPDKVKIVNGEIKTPLTNKPGNAADGKNWFANRKLGNCLACHANQDMSSKPFHGEIGPAVNEVATRYSPAQLRAILVDAKSVFGDQTIMPGFYKLDTGERVAKKFKGKTILNGQQVEDIIAYLLTLKK
jgi:sulfur-oxidizing protein SoxX